MARFYVNGELIDFRGQDDTPLLWVLREYLGLTGTKYGCGMAQCGACTVHVGDRAVRSCVAPVSSISAPVTTLEGLASSGQLHPVQQAFIDEQAAQCGYCTNGMIMQSIILLNNNPSPSEADVRQGLANNLCRCGSHLAVLRAVQSAASTSA